MYIHVPHIGQVVVYIQTFDHQPMIDVGTRNTSSSSRLNQPRHHHHATFLMVEPFRVLQSVLETTKSLSIFHFILTLWR